MNAEPSSADTATNDGHEPHDALRLEYGLKVTSRDAVVCDIRGKAVMAHALHRDLRRDSAANFNRLMGLLLLQPALIQLNSFVNDRRRADIAARDAAEHEKSPPSTTDTALPLAEPLDAPLDLSPTAPPTARIA